MRDLARRIRKNMQKSELVSKAQEKSSKKLFRLEIGHKVTECRETEDQLIRDMLESTASPIWATGGTNGDNPTELARSDVDAVVATLQNNNADFVMPEKMGEMKIGTGPIRDSYLVMCHTNMIGQLENVQGFIAKAQYPNDKDTQPSEWGSIGNTRYFLSSRGSITANASMLGADVYNLFVAGQESYGTVSLDGGNAQYIYHGPGLESNLALNTYVKAQVLEKFLLIDLEAYVMQEAA